MESIQPARWRSAQAHRKIKRATPPPPTIRGAPDQIKGNGSKQLVIHADARHSIGSVPSASNGPDPRAYQAKWIEARLAGKPFASEYWFVEPSGKIDKTPPA